jgi:hypothetical protein
MTYRLHHANEREHAQKCIPTRQGKAQIKRLLHLRHDHRTKRNEHHVRGNDPDYERPIIGSKADRRLRMEVALDGESQQVRRCHQVFGEVVDKSRHCITKENNQDQLRLTSTRSSLNKFCDLGWFQEGQVFNIAQPAKKTSTSSKPTISPASKASLLTMLFRCLTENTWFFDFSLVLRSAVSFCCSLRNGSRFAQLHPLL